MAECFICWVLRSLADSSGKFEEIIMMVVILSIIFLFTNKPVLTRHCSAEEKIEIFQNKLEYLCQSYQCPRSVISENLIKIQELDTRKAIEDLVNEQFSVDYKIYVENLQKTIDSVPTDPFHLMDLFNGVCDFCYASHFYNSCEPGCRCHHLSLY